MKKLNQILSVLMGMIFIVSSTGILIYKTHCECTGNEQVSVYVKPESCEKELHKHHSHDISGNEKESAESCCHECSPAAHDCGCTAPEVRYFKLMNQFSNDEVRFVKAQTVKITAIVLTALIKVAQPSVFIETDNSYIDPPPKIASSKTFLIQVHQLKISISA